jgi:glycosyltransferase involved in cell wall biosynthesis
MRILMLAQFYPPIIGGEERHVKNLSAQLAARGHHIAVATILHKGMLPFEMDGNVRVHRIRSTMQRAKFLFSEEVRFHAPSFPDPELTSALEDIIKQEQPDVIHAHNWLIYSFLPLKPHANAKLVLTVHDHSLICPKKKLIYGDAHCTGPGPIKCIGCAGEHYGLAKGAPVLLTNQVMQAWERKSVDMFVPVSTAVGEDNRLMGKGLPVRVIPNFVPDTVGQINPTPHPKTAELPQGDFILFVGAFGRYKGVDVLVEAHQKLKNAPPLVIIGYKTQEYPVQTENFPANVVVLQDWPHEAVMQAWARCSFGVVPSVWSDPCPTTAMEGMACGKAIVASAMGGLTDIVAHEDTGLLVPPGNADALAAAMQNLVDDPALRVRMGAAGKRKVVEFQAGTVISQIENLYTELVCGKLRAPHMSHEIQHAA